MNWKRLLFLFIVAGATAVYLLHNRKNPSYEYYFSQQHEETCHLCSWYNFGILQSLRNRLKGRAITTKTLHENVARHDKYYWYALDSLIYMCWCDTLNTMDDTHPVSTQYPEVTEMIETMTRDGVTIPHIYRQREKTVSVFEEYNFKGIGLFFLLPGTCLSVTDMERLKVNMGCMQKELRHLIEFPEPNIDYPFYLDTNGGSFTFDLQQQRFIRCVGIDDSKQSISRYYQIPVENVRHVGNITIDHALHAKYEVTFKTKWQVYLPLTRDQSMKKQYGKQSSNNGRGLGITDPYRPDNKLIIYGSNLLFWMMLSMGVDSKNENITQGHYMYRHYIALQNAMTEFDEHGLRLNMWCSTSNKHFKKENLFQYHLTGMLMLDQPLCDIVESLLEKMPIPVWKTYCNLEEYYNQYGEQFKDTKYKHWILGRHQMMSYNLSLIMWLLWHGSLSYRCFSAALQIPAVVGWYVWRRLLTYCQNARCPSTGYCMLDVIDMLCARFSRCKQREFVSMCSHGSVVSFEPDLLAMQLQAASNAENIDLLRRLPCFIDSWNGDILGRYVFYAM